MTELVYQTFPGDQLTDEMLAKAAILFSENYGIWGDRSRTPGQPIKISVRRLREQYLPKAAGCSYTMVSVDGNFAGQAFHCRWAYNGKTVCWITQLVVHKNYRERGLARGLLMSLKTDTDDIFGIISSHAAACLAAAASYCRTIEKISLDFMRENAEAVTKASPIPYIKSAIIRGSIFGQEDSTGLVSGVDTGFFVDHEGPLEALKEVRTVWNWPLGDLLDGHEFLLIVPATQRRPTS